MTSRKTTELQSAQTTDDGVTLALREDLSRRLSVDTHLVKPCVALIPPQAQGRRGEFCHVLAVEYVRAGAERDVVIAELAAYAERCVQPPRADHTFTKREVLTTVRSVAAKARRERLRGYGCNSGPLSEICPYDGDKRACPYIRRLRRPPRREKISTLLGAWNAAQSHRRPSNWSSRQYDRRRLIYMALGALENTKGYAGAELIADERELAWHTRVTRSTLRRDLPAMVAASWIEYKPGLSRRGRAGEIPVGTRIRRLLPGERILDEVREVFPDAEETP